MERQQDKGDSLETGEDGNEENDLSKETMPSCMHRTEWRSATDVTSRENTNGDCDTASRLVRFNFHNVAMKRRGETLIHLHLSTVFMDEDYNDFRKHTPTHARTHTNRSVHLINPPVTQLHPPPHTHTHTLSLHKPRTVINTQQPEVSMWRCSAAHGAGCPPEKEKESRAGIDEQTPLHCTLLRDKCHQQRAQNNPEWLGLRSVRYYGNIPAWLSRSRVLECCAASTQSEGRKTTRGKAKVRTSRDNVRQTANASTKVTHRAYQQVSWKTGCGREREREGGGGVKREAKNLYYYIRYPRLLFSISLFFFASIYFTRMAR